ncbi:MULTISPECIES: hypothetical protein [Acinetobacter]|uniref:hypothetical protein n=1 Tax=Acinetobacter TaxID=469 RepID=UPI001F0524EB|nr:MULTISPECIES: hypothetical protein [Acinetobacter]MCH2003661.1 hypothetical protein [Acinetobacter seifertii]WQF74942.1 hypothetical protein OKW95_19595 [Acinetobacter oleivorans]
MSLDQLFRREFFLKVLMTIGVVSLKTFTGFSEAHIEDMALGNTEISNDEIESIFKALAGGA